MTPWPCVARMAVQRLVLRERQDGHCRHSGVYSGMTWSPFLTLVTPLPMSTTTPAPSWPRMAGNSPSGSAPDSVNSSVWQTPVALISTSTSPSRGPSSWTVVTSSGFPAATATAARTSMAFPHCRWLNFRSLNFRSLNSRLRYVIARERPRMLRPCRIAYDRATRALNESAIRATRRAHGAGDFRGALEHRLRRDQVRAQQRRAADLSFDPHGMRGRIDGDHCRDRSTEMA